MKQPAPPRQNTCCLCGFLILPRDAVVLHGWAVAHKKCPQPQTRPTRG